MGRFDPRTSRRQVLALAGLGGLAAMLPGPLRAQARRAGGGRHRFLFVFCPGGWDQVQVFAPIFDNDAIDREFPATAANVGGIDFVDGDSRPAVRSFFEDWADRTCIVNGIQIQSVAHEICRKLVMTGGSRGDRDDWASRLAAADSAGLAMPFAHLGGPAFPVAHGDAIVRVGEAGQLPGLLDGGALAESDLPHDAPTDAVQALEESFHAARVAELQARAGRGRERALFDAEALAVERAARLAALGDRLALDDASDTAAAARVVAELFEQDLARCGMVTCMGRGGGGWDTHSGNEFQDRHFDLLFSSLGDIMVDLAERPGSGGGSLLDETTVVVMSEMGRVPAHNASAGKEHWTWTSAMLVGAGIAGGRTVGGWSYDVEGLPTDLRSGETGDGGVTLQPGHLGATLLALADVDPDEGSDLPPIEAVLA
ncbi:MAG: DUF1501 domain-containing protein [Alphaproteobacteria bacterium]|nr:DUF1501 domain-containing protein [Alphaproteobacteria bacterium]